MTRRAALSALAPAVGVLSGVLWWRYPRTPLGPIPPADLSPSIHKSDEEWWSQLTPQQFYVTRRAATDPPFSGTMHTSHAQGSYSCVCCDQPLFHSDAKYDSGTGWPAFKHPVELSKLRSHPGDTLQSGIEVRCARCDAHLGHIFDDGPPPDHLRYCINESALRFSA